MLQKGKKQLLYFFGLFCTQVTTLKNDNRHAINLLGIDLRVSIHWAVLGDKIHLLVRACNIVYSIM